MLSLLIFPEGTDLSESNVMKSNTYAKQNNLKEREYVLHPKSTGEKACILEVVCSILIDL